MKGGIYMLINEVANIFPMMSEDEFSQLVEDIKKNGQHEPIWLYQGKIIDGRNRYKACCQLNIDPKYQEWDGNGSLVFFVLSLNLNRRHLSSSQKAVIAIDILPLLESEAKERKRVAGEQYGRGHEKDSQIIEQPINTNKSTEKAAKVTGSNRQYVSDVKAIAKQSPEVMEHIRQGTLTVPEAKKISKLPKDKRETILQKVTSGEEKTVRNAMVSINKQEATRLRESPLFMQIGKYRVIEIDPPWKLNGEEAKSQVLKYPLMDLDEIKALRGQIDEIAEDDCHLYLWAINPMLSEAFEVMESLGFKYKTCVTWVKSNGFGTGHYFRGQTEHILFGVRGKMDTLRNDQASYFEAPRGKHSEKPGEFYDMVESMSPGPRIRMFARSNREGWVSWGNEV